MEAYGMNAWQGTRSVDCIAECSIPLTVKHQGGAIIKMKSYGMNAQEGGSMCQVLTEHAQTLGTTHKGGGNREIYGCDILGCQQVYGSKDVAECELALRNQPWCGCGVIVRYE